MEPAADVRKLDTAGSPPFTEGAAGVRRGQLRVGDIMSKDVVTAALDDTISSAVTRMSEHYVSCLVVMNDGRVTGILTEKDLLKGVGGRNPAFHALRVSDQMSSPVKLISPDASIVEAGRIMETNRIRRLPVVQDGQLVGIVTQTDITRGLISLTPLRCVSDIMTRRVTAVAADATIAEAARIMSSCNISCLIVMIRGEVAGILSEKDVLRRVVAVHKDPTQTHVTDIMSFPVVAVPRTFSVLSASKKMETMRLHRLVVMEDKKVYGILTQTDIMRAIQNAFETTESQRRVLAAELTDLVHDTIRELEKIRDFLEGLADPLSDSGASPDAAKPSEGQRERNPVGVR
jgi:CBS domain-containing protein